MRISKLPLHRTYTGKGDLHLYSSEDGVYHLCIDSAQDSSDFKREIDAFYKKAGFPGYVDIGVLKASGWSYSIYTSIDTLHSPDGEEIILRTPGKQRVITLISPSARKKLGV